jgi:hypothetical protein
MVAIEKLPGIQPREVPALNGAGIRQDTELWESLERQGIQQLATDTSLDSNRLFELLAQCRTGQDRANWGQRHWPELLLTALILLLLVPWLQIRNSRQVVVRTAGGLPALHLIQRQDLRLARGRKLADGFESTSDVLGRLTLQEIAAGEPLRAEQLGPSPGRPWPGRRVLALPVRAELLAGLGRGSRVGLLLSPRKAGPRAQAILIEDVLVLSIQRDVPSSLLIAVRTKDLPALGRHLGATDVLILQ